MGIIRSELDSFGNQLCYVRNFIEHAGKRINCMRTRIITDIHGQRETEKSAAEHRPQKRVRIEEEKKLGELLNVECL